MKYHLIMLAILCSYASFGQSNQKPEVEIREQIAAAVTSLQVSPEEIASITNRTITQGKDSINIRVYSPATTGDFPIVYYVHGGVWVAGDLNTHDNICRSLSKHLQAVVVAVDYRRPPEHKFPNAFNDCYTIFKWVASHSKELNGNGIIFVTGDSAGAQLVASLCQANQSESKKIPITAQILINPSTDLRKSSTSYKLYGEIIDWYLNEADNKNDFRISPLVGDNISGLPPAIIIVGEHDELRGEGEAYHQRLQSRNIKSFLFVHPSAGHLAAYWCAAHEVAMPALAFIVDTVRENFVKK